MAASSGSAPENREEIREQSTEDREQGPELALLICRCAKNVDLIEPPRLTAPLRHRRIEKLVGFSRLASFGPDLSGIPVSRR
jgi:hypothetical protein